MNQVKLQKSCSLLAYTNIVCKLTTFKVHMTKHMTAVNTIKLIPESKQLKTK